jgi:hypothetical protein
VTSLRCAASGVGNDGARQSGDDITALIEAIDWRGVPDLESLTISWPATSRSASGFLTCFPRASGTRVNRGGDHLDLTIGSDDAEVSGVTISGEIVPLLRGGRRVAGATAS